MCTCVEDTTFRLDFSFVSSGVPLPALATVVNAMNLRRAQTPVACEAHPLFFAELEKL
jgi:hypothetical protein